MVSPSSNDLDLVTIFFMMCTTPDGEAAKAFGELRSLWMDKTIDIQNVTAKLKRAYAILKNKQWTFLDKNSFARSSVQVS